MHPEPKTVAEVQDNLKALREYVETHELSTVGVISDYPIGQRVRGQCELTVEIHPTRGLRTGRRTTDKHGHWCKPKYSTYRAGGVLAVCRNPVDGKFAWLEIQAQGAWLLAATMARSTVIVNGPNGGYRPRRQPESYTLSVQTMFSKPGEGVVQSHHTKPADPPELCDAYDAWVSGLAEIKGYVNHKILMQMKARAV